MLDVIVIGGGFAGVTATRDLAAAGMSVLLLEARDRLGGRTWYRRFADTDRLVEFGGTWVAPDQGQRHVGQELARYGLALVRSPDPDHYLWHTGGELRRGWPVPPEQAMDLERAVYHVIAASRRIDFGTPLDQQDVADLDVSVTDFFAPLELPPATLDLFTAFAGFGTGAAAEDVSALHLLEWIAGFGNSAYAFFGTVSQKLELGTTALWEAMMREAEAKVLLATPVGRVAQDSERVTVWLRDGREYSARAAVVAVPLNVLGDIDFAPQLSTGKLTASSEANAGRSTKVWALVEGGPQPMVAVGEGGPLKWLSTEYQMDGAHLMVSFGNAPETFDLGSADHVQRAVEHLAPGARLVKFDAHDWNADEFAKGTWMAWRAGQATRHASAVQQREGRLLFAGSDTSSHWPGWIDGAIESGARAASQARELLGAPEAVAGR